MMQNTLSVQSFIRTVVWIVSMLVLSPLLLVADTLSKSLTGTGAVLFVPALIFVMWVSVILSKMFYILPEWEKIVLLKLGKYEGIKGAGFFVIPPFIYSVAAIIDTRIETHQIEATATLTKDNVPTKITAAVEFRVEDPKKAVIDVQNYRLSVTWLSTEALKNTIGSLDLKELLSERDQIAKTLQEQIDNGAVAYGVDVRAVRITDIDTPATLIEELAVIARARRTSEAKRIQAEAEVYVAQKTLEASLILSGDGADGTSMRLRELQTMTEISKEGRSTIVLYPYGDRDGKEMAHAVGGQHTNRAEPFAPKQ